MAENKEKPADKGAKKEAAPKAETVSDTPQDAARREQRKSRWTLQTCMKVAKRFNARTEWAAGAPSCYKAATAKGWVDQCAKHMTNAPARKTTVKPAAASTTKTGKGTGTGVIKKSA